MRIDVIDGLSLWSSLTMSGNLTTTPVALDHIYGYSVQVVWTGATASGAFTIEASDDVTSVPANIVNWETVGSSSIAASGPGSAFYNYNGAFYKWFRLKYAYTSGTGTITASNIVIKGA